MWRVNPRRIQELFNEEAVKRAADALLSYRNREVLEALAWGWGVFLFMVFSLIVTVRFAFAL